MKQTLVALAITFGLLGSPSADAAKLRGTVKVDGSSTVFPITEAVAEEFNKVEPRVRVTVGVSGTGGGFKKFVKGETDINDASRKIKDSEVALTKENKVDYIEIPVAYDGITIVVNPKNDWVDYLTVAELRKIWKPSSTVKTWKDIRASFPEKEIKLYGPGTDSGTFDFFSEAINGKSGASRSKYTKSEDDNVLVTGVQGDSGALGYFGYAYYEENKDRLRSVPIKEGKKEAVAPTVATINNGTYSPLSRPVFIYVSKSSLKKAEVDRFVKFYIENAPKLVREVGYIPLPQDNYAASLKTITEVK